MAPQSVDVAAGAVECDFPNGFTGDVHHCDDGVGRCAPELDAVFPGNGRRKDNCSRGMPRVECVPWQLVKAGILVVALVAGAEEVLVAVGDRAPCSADSHAVLDERVQCHGQSDGAVVEQEHVRVDHWLRGREIHGDLVPVSLSLDCTNAACSLKGEEGKLTVQRDEKMYKHKVRSVRELGRRFKGPLWGHDLIIFQVDPAAREARRAPRALPQPRASPGRTRAAKASSDCKRGATPFNSFSSPSKAARIAS